MFHRPKARIFSSFAFLNVTQFLGALNDNIFKLVIVFLLIGVLGEHASNTILALSGAVFVAPFLLFSIPMGTLADRFSKRKITVFTKVLEVVVMSLGVVAFGLQSIWGSFAVLFLMATQSAIFGPSKYAVVPELVEKQQISHANGILTALTVLAMIFGTFLAAFLTTLTDHNFVLIAFFCVFIAIVGLLASLCIGKTPPAGSKNVLTVRAVTQVVKILVRTREKNYLFASLIGSSYFYLVGAYAQLNVITYAIQSLDLTPVGGGYLFLTISVGIVIGSLFAGWICGRQVELGLTPIAAIGMSIFLFLLLLLDHSLIAVVVCLIILGIFGGLFLVPFDAFIQAASPEKERGENVSAGSFLSFVGVAIAAGLIALLGNVLGLSAAVGFSCMAALTLLVALILAYRMSDTFVRLLSRFVHRKNSQVLQEDDQTIFLKRVPTLKAGLLSTITLQQRYMRFLVEQPKQTTRWERFLLRLAKAETFGQEKSVERWLRRGYSLSVLQLTDQPEIADYCQRLADEHSIRILTETGLEG